LLAKFRSHLTFANVISVMALFVALSGGAYALTIPKNSVGAKQLKKNAVTGSKVKKGAVTSSKVKDRALLAKDFKAGQLPAGPQGPTGRQGAQGAPGVSGLQRVFKSSAIDNSPKTVTATCPAGKRAVGGGATHSNASPGAVVIDQIQPSDENTVPGVVTVSAYQTGAASSWSVTAFVFCANVS
jgi:hypothetical protein